MAHFSMIRPKDDCPFTFTAILSFCCIVYTALSDFLRSYRCDSQEDLFEQNLPLLIAARSGDDLKAINLSIIPSGISYVGHLMAVSPITFTTQAVNRRLSFTVTLFKKSSQPPTIFFHVSGIDLDLLMRWKCSPYLTHLKR